MEDFNTAEKKLELVRTKYELSRHSTKALVTMYNREDLYHELLSRLETVMVLDPDFILLGNHIEKYRRIIHSGRFQYRTQGNIRIYEDLTLKVLDVKEQDKEKLREQYLMEQLKLRLHLGWKDRMRMVNEKGMDQLDMSIRKFSEFDYDYLNILDQLRDEQFVPPPQPPLQYLSSMSYLIQNAEEIFLQNRWYCDATLGMIDALEDEDQIPGDYKVKGMKRKLNKMNKKR